MHGTSTECMHTYTDRELQLIESTDKSEDLIQKIELMAYRIHIRICRLISSSRCNFWNSHCANSLNFPLLTGIQICFPLNLPFFSTTTTTTFCCTSCTSESSRVWMQNTFSSHHWNILRIVTTYQKVQTKFWCDQMDAQKHLVYTFHAELAMSHAHPGHVLWQLLVEDLRYSLHGAAI